MLVTGQEDPVPVEDLSSGRRDVDSLDPLPRHGFHGHRVGLDALQVPEPPEQGRRTGRPRRPGPPSPAGAESNAACSAQAKAAGRLSHPVTLPLPGRAGGGGSAALPRRRLGRAQRRSPVGARSPGHRGRSSNLATPSASATRPGEREKGGVSGFNHGHLDQPSLAGGNQLRLSDEVTDDDEQDNPERRTYGRDNGAEPQAQPQEVGLVQPATKPARQAASADNPNGVLCRNRSLNSPAAKPTAAPRPGRLETRADREEHHEVRGHIVYPQVRRRKWSGPGSPATRRKGP